jgi:hypothetical protein
MSHPTSDDAWEQVRAALARVARDSPFYRAKLAAAGIDAAAVRTADDFHRVPLTRKHELPAAQQEAPPFGPLLAVPMARVASVSVSPGPLYIARTAAEPTGIEALHESLRHMGVRADDVAHVTLSYHILPGGLRMHRAFESFGCRDQRRGRTRARADREHARGDDPSVRRRSSPRLPRPPRSRPASALSGRLLTAEGDRRPASAGAGDELFDHCSEAVIGPLAGGCRAHDGVHLHQRRCGLSSRSGERRGDRPAGPAKRRSRSRRARHAAGALRAR